MYPKVSVLISVYNGEKYITKSIESVLNENFDDYEVIIVDDGSTDNTKKILSNYKNNKKIKVFHKENTGIPDSLNFGLKHCNGEYIARLDCDDIMVTGRLKKQVEFLDKHKEIGLLGTNAKIINSNGEKVDEINLGELKHSQIVERFTKRESFFPHSSWMVRKNIYEKLGGYDKFFYKAQDYDFVLRCINICKTHCLSEQLVELRKDETSHSFDHKFDQFKLATVALILYYQRIGKLKDLNMDKEEILKAVEHWFEYYNLEKKLTARQNLSFCKYELKASNYVSGITRISKALLNDPLCIINRKKVKEFISEPLTSILPFITKIG